ncbi:MAG: hypothetical protein Q9180_007543, partial [Flavoplaca navasiana]
MDSSPLNDGGESIGFTPDHSHRTLSEGRSNSLNTLIPPNVEVGSATACSQPAVAASLDSLGVATKHPGDPDLEAFGRHKKHKGSNAPADPSDLTVNALSSQTTAASKAFQSADVVKTTVTTQVGGTPFRYAGTPMACPNHHCAMGDLHSETPWMLDDTDLTAIEWSFAFSLDVGPAGMPHITLCIRSNIPLHKNLKDRINLKWYAHAFLPNGTLQVEDFSYEMFPTWYDRISSALRDLPAVSNVDSGSYRHSTVVVQCCLQLPVFDNLKDPAGWNNVPSPVFDRLQSLFTEKKHITFLVRSPKLYDTSLPLFSRHVKEGLGLLSQYREPTSQQYNLYKISDAKSLQEVGEGMYILSSGEIFEFPRVYRFAFPLQFWIFAALTPIREAQKQAALRSSPNEDQMRRYQRELTAVDKFCNHIGKRDHKPSYNLRDLLMCGASSGGNPKPTMNLCGTDPENIKKFDAVMEYGRASLKDEQQLRFVEKLKE